MLRIEICDPMGHSASELRALSLFLSSVAIARELKEGTSYPVNASKDKTVAEVIAEKIAKNDVPDVGRDLDQQARDHLNKSMMANAAAPEKNFATPSPAEAFAAVAQSFPNAVPLPPAPPPVDALAPAPFTPPAPGTAVEVDEDGLPWDVRIHSSSRAKVQDGTWKKKRGTGETYVLEVEAQLRGAMIAPQPRTRVPAVPMSGVASLPLAPPQGLMVPPKPAVAWPFPTAAESAAEARTNSFPPPPPTPPSTVSAITTFPQLVVALTAAKGAGRVTDEGIRASLATVGIAALPLLAVRSDLIPAFSASLGL